jgi:hypothetical protein
MVVVGLAVLALTGMAGATTSGALSGEALVLEKNVALGTVTLEGQIVLHVSESTRIIAANGRRITLAELPVARRVSGGIEESVEATVRYEARLVAGEKVADEIRVGGMPPR